MEFKDVDSKYTKLIEVFDMAYQRAAVGKGYQRHSLGEPFEEQVICRGPRIFGVGALLYQIYKKAEEIMKLESLESKSNELLDIIVYAAAAILILKEIGE